MKQLHKLLYFISIFIVSVSFAQQKKDTVKVKKSYGFSIGVDVSKPIISIFDKTSKGFEFVGDIKVLPNLYAAMEFGSQNTISNEDYINFTTKGNYLKLGFNYNAYKNWKGMSNQIYVGLRYGISSFTQTLDSYTPNQSGTYFSQTTITPNTKFNNLNTKWAALVFGLKVETFKNVYLGTSIQFNKMLSTKEPTNFKNMFVPGFNRVYLNNLGISFNYTISYYIPIIK